MRPFLVVLLIGYSYDIPSDVCWLTRELYDVLGWRNFSVKSHVFVTHGYDIRILFQIAPMK